MRKILIISILLFTAVTGYTQNQDTVNVLQNTANADSAVKEVITAKVVVEDSAKKETRKRDTFFLKKKEYTPRGATLRSLILPGWGQAYNKQYWKIPVVAAAVGVPIGFYIDNRVGYLRSKQAVDIAFEIEKNSEREAELVEKLHPQFRISYNNVKDRPNGLEQFKSNAIRNRNYFRQNQDYSLLWTLALWGLNVADATVFAHLKNFDVSDDISMKIEPVYFNMSRTPGVRLVFTRRK